MSVRVETTGDSRRLIADIQRGDAPADFSDQQRILHAHIVPTDLSTLYHEHPQQVQPGRFELPLALAAADYALWLEVTRSSGQHIVEHLERINLGRIDTSGRQPRPAAGDVMLQPLELDVAPPGSVSHLNFMLLHGGRPATAFGRFVGVAVHAWALSADGQWLVHDHAEVVGGGRVDAHFTFPRSGDYVIFLQPALLTPAGQVEPVLRHNLRVP
jgi:hypothetical protein